MEQNLEKIELRGENVRNILGEIPPFVIRSGITVLILLLTLLITSTALITFDYTIDTIAIVEEKNNSIIMDILIPTNKIKTTRLNNGIIIQFSQISSNLKDLKNHINIDSPKTYIYKNQKYYLIRISSPPFDHVHFIGKNIVPAQIFIEKRTIMKHIIYSIKI